MLASVCSATLDGIDGRPVTVEVHVSRGLPGYGLVGLPDAAGRESRERVRAALLSSGLEWPQARITVNLAPAAVRKAGAGYEAAIACGVLLASGALPAGVLEHTAVLGELGLDGALRHVPGTLALVDALARAGVERVIVPLASAREAALVRRVEVLAASTLAELHACLKGEWPWADPPAASDTDLDADASAAAARGDDPLDLAEVRGLTEARRALAACAAGGHNLLLVGPPGAGKTMLARRLSSISAPLPHDPALAVTRIHSAAGQRAAGGLVELPPFRAPHHGASAAALVGGGSNGRIRVGEVTLAHHGVLFLDELGEFAPNALEALRQPIEDRVVRVCRAGITSELPADFVLLACCNPCPCGLGDARCRCNDIQQARYRRRLSAPLLDRFDLRLRVEGPQANEAAGEPSSVVRARVVEAVERQSHRFRHARFRRNAHVPAGALDRYIELAPDARAELVAIGTDRALSGRGLARVRRVARTIADLDGCAEVEVAHLAVAAELRQDVV